MCIGAAAALRAFTLRLDSTLERVVVSERTRRLSLRGGLAAALVAIGTLAIATDLPSRLDEQISASAPSGDARDQLTTFNPNGRFEHWRVALDVFAEKPLLGSGAGTYANSWSIHRPDATEVKDAHTLYLEVLSELGIVGGLLLLGVLATILLGLAQRVRGPDRGLYTAILAAMAAWLGAAALDWHWELPAVTLWLFALGGAALASSRRQPAPLPPSTMVLRVAAAAVCCVLIAVIPARVAISHDRIQNGLRAFISSDCERADREARRAIDVFSGRPEPYEIVGYCALARGDQRRAAQAMLDAVDRDPKSWRPWYALALVRAGSETDPRPALRRAQALSPREPIVRLAVQRIGGTPPPFSWKQAATGLPVPAALDLRAAGRAPARSRPSATGWA